MVRGDTFLRNLVFYSLVKEAARQSAYENAPLKLAWWQAKEEKPKFPTIVDVLENRPLNVGLMDVVAREAAPVMLAAPLMALGFTTTSELAKKVPNIQSAWLKRLAGFGTKYPWGVAGILGGLGYLGGRALINRALSRKYELQDL